MMMIMMMGLPDLDIRAGLLLNCDALWLEIYNSLTSASLIHFPLRKVRACSDSVCACVCDLKPSWDWFSCIFSELCFVSKHFWALQKYLTVACGLNGTHLMWNIWTLYCYSQACAYSKMIHMYRQMKMHILQAKAAAKRNLNFNVNFNIFLSGRRIRQQNLHIYTTWVQSTWLYHTKMERCRGYFLILPIGITGLCLLVLYHMVNRHKPDLKTHMGYWVIVLATGCVWWWCWYSAACCNTASRRCGIQKNSSSSHPHIQPDGET